MKTMSVMSSFLSGRDTSCTKTLQSEQTSSTNTDISESSTPLGYSIPPTPAASCNSFCSSVAPQHTNKIVVLTRVNRFLPTHILNTLLTQEYTVRGLVTYGEEDMTRLDVEALFNIHPLTRKYLFLQRVTPLDPKDWERAFTSANYVIHMVTPFTLKMPSTTEDDMIYPALEITRNILRACVKVRTVQRVVLITSTASIAWSKEKTGNTNLYNENVWEDEENLTGYAKCQLACEKAAWNFVNCLPESDKIELVVLNPAFVLGPMIQGKSTQTMSIIKALMESTFSWLPSSSLPLVDVRDVARAAAVALVKQEAVGQRHILFCKSILLEEIAIVLDHEFTRQGYNVLPSTRVMDSKSGCGFCYRHEPPKELSLLKEFMTGPICYDNSRMRNILRVDFHFPEETIIETAYSLIFWGFIKRRDPRPRDNTLLSCIGRRRSPHRMRVFPSTSSHFKG